MAEQGETGRDHPRSASAHVARSLDRHGPAVIALALLVAALLALPFVLMEPTATASQEPGGVVFEARDLLAERLPSPIHHMVFVIEARDGDVLDKGSLVELLDRAEALRGDPELGPKLAHWRSENPRADVHGLVTLADVVDRVLRVQGMQALQGLPGLPSQGLGGLRGATEEQNAQVLAMVLEDPGPGVFGLSPAARRDPATGRWVAPALLGHVLADNQLLGGGSVDAVLGSDDTTKEEYARAVLAVLRGDEAQNQTWGLAIDVNLTSSEQGRSAGPYIALTLLAVLVLLGLTFRSYWAVAVTGLGLGMLMIWLHGICNLIGLKNDQILSIIVPIAMISFGVDFAFHALGRYREELAGGAASPRSAFVVGLGSVMAALLVAMVSDAVAFLSNASAGIESLVQFAIAASIATLSALLVLGVFTPLVVSRLEERFGVPRLGRRESALVLVAGLLSSLWAMGTVVVSVFVLPLGGAALLAGQGLVCLGLPVLVLSRLHPRRQEGAAPPPRELAGGGAPRIGAFVVWTTRQRRVLLPVLGLVTLVAAWAGQQSRASFDVRDFFSASTDFVVGLDKYDQHGSAKAGEPADIYIEADLSDPRVLATLRRARDELRQLDTDRLALDDADRIKVGGGVVALVEAMQRSDRARAALAAAGEPPLRDADGDGLPDTARQIAGLVRFARDQGVVGDADGEVLLSAAVARSMAWLAPTAAGTPRSGATRLGIQILGSRVQEQVQATRDQLEPFVARLQADLRADDPAARAILTGGAIVRQASLDAILLAFRLSFPVAVLLCLLAAALFMRSLRYGFVSTIPVILVAIWLYGFMFAVGYSLNVVTATIGAISIGVGIDFSVHFTMRFREELVTASSRLEALRAAGSGTGQALAASAFSSALGFTILAFAPMPMFASYGLLTAVMIVLALAAALGVLPMLLLLVTPERPGEPSAA